MIKAAILGYGTIGSGVAEILMKKQEKIQKACGQEVRLAYVLDLREFPGSPVEDKLIHDYERILQDPEVLVVVETMGGLDPAYPYVKAALMAGKHVVTSNKALVAAHGTELLAIAGEKQVNFLFEASAGGGIPIIRTLYRSLAGEEILGVTGILNGTTNYILTKMDEEGASFEAVLAEAQALGYAERNPEADVEGRDTCRKIAILTALVTGKEVNYQDIYTEGITRITNRDLSYARKLGASVKLLGNSRMTEDGVYAWVAPVMVGKSHPLYAVSGVYNGILVEGEMLGTAMFYGRGAGRLPTASAVAADIIEAVQNHGTHIPMGWTSEKLIPEPMDSSVHRYFVRVGGTEAERRALAEQNFGKADFIEDGGTDEFAVLTGEMTEGDFKKRSAAFDAACGEMGGDGIRQIIRAWI